MNSNNPQPTFTLFSTYHKPFPVPSLSFIKPIQAGKANSTIDLGFEGDNTGDNISSQNPYWSELTVIYYIWKNYNKERIPYWGLCHYRRYFTRHLHWARMKKIYPLSPAEKAFDQIFTPELNNTIQKHLSNGSVIVAAPYKFLRLRRMTIKQQYINYHGPDAWLATEDAITRLYPDYLQSSKEFMNGIWISLYNMMIASWEFWDGYLKWMFDILFDIQKQLESKPEPVPERIYGYISERLLNIYLHHHIKNNGQKVKYLPVVNIV